MIKSKLVSQETGRLQDRVCTCTCSAHSLLSDTSSKSGSNSLFWGLGANCEPSTEPESDFASNFGINFGEAKQAQRFWCQLTYGLALDITWAIWQAY